MEDYRNCPICFEVPEKEIYQCETGHTICKVCIASLTKCPQCRAIYGEPRIRSRVLEDLLDLEEFKCKFSEEGCAHICKRSEISSHAESCNFSTETIPLCKLLLIGRECNFGLGCCTRQQVIEHFEGIHKCSISSSPFVLNGERFMAWMDQRSKHPKNILGIKIISMESSEASELFLCCMLLNKSNGLSFLCTQIWGSNDDSKTYILKCKFLREAPLSPTNQTCVQSNSGVKVNPFPIGWSLKVCTLKEFENMLKIGTVGLPIELLKTAQFGTRTGDKVTLEIVSLRTKYP